MGQASGPQAAYLDGKVAKAADTLNRHNVPGVQVLEKRRGMSTVSLRYPIVEQLTMLRSELNVVTPEHSRGCGKSGSVAGSKVLVQ